MRSSTGAHFIALDHVRALAAFIVFTWHFIHASSGYPVPFDIVPTVFPLAILDEGHTGVALFMVLSGYLFAKLLDGKTIHFPAFLFNRALRLLPLLAVVLVISAIIRYAEGGSMLDYAQAVAKGVLWPSLPNGGWSITVEFHYYAALPLLLWMVRRSKIWLVAVLLAALALRTALHQLTGEVQSWAYWTLVGRIDQFVLGMLVFQLRGWVARRHLAMALVALAFTGFYWWFDGQGGFMRNPAYPSPSPLWIFLPTIEGLAYSLVIAWYDTSFIHRTTGISRLLGKVGEYSYSIYLLHFYLVFAAARLVHTQVMNISNFYLACAWALATFALVMVPLGYLSFRFIEAPFLSWRRPYLAGTGV